MVEEGKTREPIEQHLWFYGVISRSRYINAEVYNVFETEKAVFLYATKRILLPAKVLELRVLCLKYRL